MDIMPQRQTTNIVLIFKAYTYTHTHTHTHTYA